MSTLLSVELRAPYLIFIGDIESKLYAKTGLGIVEWRRELVAGQLAFEGNALDLGVPYMSIESAVAAGVKSVVVGVAPVGGTIGPQWIDVLVKAAKADLDIVSGLHFRLSDYPELKDAAAKSGAALIDVRVPPNDIPVGTGKKRTGKRLLMVGTDCAVGKKYSALKITETMKAFGLKATFRASGQTGIMIAGTGIPIDSIVADFVSGAAELLSPDNDPEHWDIIEGQGSLFNASYAGVSLSLLHGSQPDAIIVCHDPTRCHVSSCPDIIIPTVAECIDLNLRCGRLTNADIKCVGVCINTSGLSNAERKPYLQKLSEELDLPCIDPLQGGCMEIVHKLLANGGL